MSFFVPLDSGVIGLLCSSPMIPEVAACDAWFVKLKLAGTILVIPDITLYEIRRELIRIKATAKLERLEKLQIVTRSARVTPEAWLKAAEFWAIVRYTGRPTADPHALDGDAILAGVAATIGTVADSVTIATTNVGHLARFPEIDAQEWEAIT